MTARRFIVLLFLALPIGLFDGSGPPPASAEQPPPSRTLMEAFFRFRQVLAEEQAKDKEKAKEPEPEKIKELPKLKPDPVQELVGKHKELIPVLIAALRDGDSEVRQTTAYTLVQLGKEAVPALTAALDDKDLEMRANAAIVLGQFGKQAQEALPALLRAMQDPVPEVRRRVIYAISRIVEASSRAESAESRGYATMVTTVPVRQVSAVADYRPRDPGLILKLLPETQPPAPKRLPLPEAP